MPEPILIPVKSKPQMGMMMWMATEGGRKCPQCCRYARRQDLGMFTISEPGIRMDVFGHLPGTGCNKGGADAS